MTKASPTFQVQRPFDQCEHCGNIIMRDRLDPEQNRWLHWGTALEECNEL